jgi:voltage-gated potassium channel
MRHKINDIINPHSESLWSRAYDYVMLMAIVMSIVPLMFRAHHSIFYIVELVASALFIIDYVLRWVTADLHSRLSGWRAFAVYPFTPMAIVDMLSILPTFNVLGQTFRVARVSRLLRLLRVVKFIRYFEPLEIILAVIHRQRRILWTVFSLALFYIFITALIMFNAEEPINPETGDYLFPTFFDAFYWAACTLTTVGYGDIYPISGIGRVISILSSIVGIAVIALPSGIMTAGYIDELRARKENKVKKEG